MAFDEKSKIHTLKSGMILDKIIIIILALALVLAIIWMFIMLCRQTETVMTTAAVTTTKAVTTRKKKDLADLAIRLARG